MILLVMLPVVELVALQVYHSRSRMVCVDAVNGRVATDSLVHVKECVHGFLYTNKSKPINFNKNIPAFVFYFNDRHVY